MNMKKLKNLGKKCKGCTYENSYCVPSRLNENNCEQDRKETEVFNARSYVEKSPQPLKAKMSFCNVGKVFAFEVEIVPYISLGGRDPAIRYKGETALVHNLSSLWRHDKLNFKLADGKALTAREMEEELYKQ